MLLLILCIVFSMSLRNRINSDDFDKLIEALVDSQTFNIDGKIAISLEVKDLNKLGAHLGLPPGDNAAVLAVLEALSNKLDVKCPGGKCAGTVIQKLPGI